MGTVNKTILLGRLGSDVELNETKTGMQVANISLATDNFVKGGDKTTEWHKIVLWDKLALNADKYLSKGSEVYIEGRLQTRSYESKEGLTKYTTEVVANNMQFIGGKGGGDVAAVNQNFEGADAPF
jgi:single-strand DNA-binding protein